MRSRQRIRTAAMSIARGNGKSTFAGLPGRSRADAGRRPTRQSGPESVLIAGSIEQAQNRFSGRAAHPGTDRRVPFSGLGDSLCYHSQSVKYPAPRNRQQPQDGDGTSRLSTGHHGRTGYVCETNAGELMFHAVRTAQGKPDSPLRAILIGTLAPATSGWWPDLIAAGSTGSTYVMALQARLARWDQDAEIARVNPLMWNYK